MASTHFTLAEAAAHLADLVERACAGEEILIDTPGQPSLSLQVSGIVQARKSGPAESFVREPLHAFDSYLIDEANQHLDPSIEATVARAKHFEQLYGPLPMGADFADTVEEVIANRKPRDTSLWD